MGRVTATAKIQNNSDLEKMHEGLLDPSQIRTVEVDDALVDTGALGLSMPLRLITQLGLRPVSKKRMLPTNGVVERTLYASVRIWDQGESCTIDVHELPDNVPVLVGQIPLEAMDWVVDKRGRRLIPNPAHGGEHMIEQY